MHELPDDPGSNVPWRVETNGINVLGEDQCSGTARDLFWVWFAANVGVLDVIIGGIVYTFRLSLFEMVVVVVGGTVASFALVGVLSVAGLLGRAPMMTLSRRVFGLRGNLVPGFVSWVSLAGWETLAVITGTLAVMGVLQMVAHLGGVASGLVSLAVVGGMSVAFGLLGQATLVVVQRWGSWILGGLTCLVAGELVRGAGWHQVATARGGSFLGAVLPAMSIVVASTGLSWSNAAADYSRYTTAVAGRRRVFLAGVAGASVPMVLLLFAGVLAGSRDASLASSPNPVDAIRHALPGWMAVPYLLTAAAGMVVQADLGLYSSGMNLLNLRVRMRRSRSVLIDAAIMLAGSIYVLFIARNFLTPFTSFILILGVGLAAWAGVFVAAWAWPSGRPSTADLAVIYSPDVSTSIVTRGVGWPAISGFLAGSLAGILTSASPSIARPAQTSATPALSKVAISQRSRAAAPTIGTANAAPVPSPNRIDRSSNGLSPNDRNAARAPGSTDRCPAIQ